MGLTLNARRIAGWMAVLAMSLNALWPLLANAKPASAFDPATEICTVGGIKSFAGGSVPQPADKLHQPSCAYCTLGVDKLALPSTGVALALHAPQKPAFQAVTAGLQQAQPFGYPPAHPRAPPLFS